MQTETQQSVREVLESLARANGGQITPQIVLDEAKKKRSPLHSHFCWDDNEAAAAWRLHQASALIRRVKVTLETAPEKTISVRAFMSVTPVVEQEADDDDEEPSKPAGYYVPVRVAMTEYREQVLARAVSELRAMKSKYAHLTELAAVWEAIDKT